MDLEKTAQRLQIQRNMISRCAVFHRYSATPAHASQPWTKTLQPSQIQRNFPECVATPPRAVATCRNVALDTSKLRRFTEIHCNLPKSIATFMETAQPSRPYCNLPGFCRSLQWNGGSGGKIAQPKARTLQRELIPGVFPPGKPPPEGLLQHGGRRAAPPDNAAPGDGSPRRGGEPPELH